MAGTNDRHAGTRQTLGSSLKGTRSLQSFIFFSFHPKKELFLKIGVISSIAIGALAISAISSTAWANGKHAGGHDESTIGKLGVAAKINRTVTIDMSDAMRFTPANLNVRQGETIRFIVQNSGNLKHEFVLGIEKDLKAHYEAMKKYPEMEHADNNMVTVAPGKTGEVIWQFTKAGKVAFACLHPGHYEAGMKGLVTVDGGGKMLAQK